MRMSDEKSVSELRAQVDEINMAILDLLTRRANIVSEIGKAHTQLGVAHYDPSREAEMLTALERANKGPFSNETIKALFREIFRASLEMEEQQARAKIRVQRHSPDERTIIRMPDGYEIGAGNFSVIAGSCSVESHEQMDEVAAAVSARGVRIMRGMAWKPRTSP